jgi:hypothetical protein
MGALCLLAPITAALGGQSRAAPPRDVAATGPRDAAGPAAQALLIPAYGSPPVTGNPVIVATSGYGPQEPISLRLSAIDPLTGVVLSTLFQISGESDSNGQLSNLVGSPPLSPQTVPMTATAGIYSLRAIGLTTGISATTLLSSPLAPKVDGALQCPSGAVLPGQPIAVSGSGAGAGTAVLAVADFPPAPQVSTTADGGGAYSLTFTAPSNPALQTVTIVAATLTTIGSTLYTEQLHACTVVVGAPTATPTATATATATAIPTATPTATARTPSTAPFPTAAAAVASRAPAKPAPVLVGMLLHISTRITEPGQMVQATVRTRPRTRLSFTVTYNGQTTQTSATLRSDASGAASFPFVVAAGPGGAGGPLQGTLTVRVTEPGFAGTATIRFAVYPPLHTSVQTHLTQQDGLAVLALTVEMARPGRVTAMVQMPGGDGQQVQSIASADGTHPLTLLLPLGTLPAGTSLRVAVRIVSKDGVVEIRTLTVTVHG